MNDAFSTRMPIRCFHFFDDIHLKISDLVRSEMPLRRNLQNLAANRAGFAIFTTSGQTQLDFTDGRDKIHDTLKLLRPRRLRQRSAGVPDVSYYMADQIQ